ncbi:hypothetical protein OH76DRAFT_190449 [Lentinus brumalis]|uniref:Uncharacterized protein n=1 Tax=Lentinus brumalis TaxID=2498619 RepID=A0A371CN29_9APHY|nr:hypothetical protein OH76DRAFT_190449 [Polyporus brumalis]
MIELVTSGCPSIGSQVLRRQSSSLSSLLLLVSLGTQSTGLSCGIGAPSSTVRGWEKRFSIVPAQHEASGQKCAGMHMLRCSETGGCVRCAPFLPRPVILLPSWKSTPS